METHDSLFDNERQARITALIAQHGKVRTAQLIGLFGVSEPTLRKDLSILEQRGVLKRTHGGAVALRLPLEEELDRRAALHLPEKHAIAAACIREIKDSTSIFLDSSTTVMEIARLLPQAHKRLSVLTNSPDIADIIADIPNVSHVVLGGQWRRYSRALSGPIALDFVNRFTITTAFIGAGGVTENGISVADVNEAHLKAAVITRSERVILAVDHSKFGVSDFTRVCTLDELDTIITDKFDDHIAQLCAHHAIQLIVAEAKT